MKINAKSIRSLSFIIMFFTASFVSVLSAQNKPIDIKLWQNGYTVTNGRENEMKDGKPVSEAEMRVFPAPADKANGKAVIILPGGGYGHLAMNHEGYDLAPFFNNQGITAIVLKYRMPYGKKEVPYADVEEAMKVVKKNAKEWNVNPSEIGIMGSSAGGHLASTFATKSDDVLRPAFQILLYPVISMQNGITHAGSQKNLLGENPSQALKDAYSNENNVTAKTPRAFIALSNDDGAVIPQNTLAYYDALNKNGVDAWITIYPTGGHGWGIRDNFIYKTEFLTSLREWLRTF